MSGGLNPSATSRDGWSGAGKILALVRNGLRVGHLTNGSRQGTLRPPKTLNWQAAVNPGILLVSGWPLGLAATDNQH